MDKVEQLYYDWRGDTFTYDQLEPDKLYWVSDTEGRFHEFNREEIVTCYCCGERIEFKYKYVVDHMRRYCMLCYDVCKKGNYPTCVQKVYYQGYHAHKAKTDYNIPPNPSFTTSIYNIPRMLNEISIHPYGIIVQQNSLMPKDQIRIIHGDNEILLTGLEVEQ